MSLQIPPSLPDPLTSISQLHQHHAQLLKTNFFRHPFSGSRLLSAAATLSTTPSYPHSIFSHLQDPNTFSYNSLIRAYSISPTPLHSLTLFLHMLHDPNVVPDEFTFTFVLKACGALKNVNYGRQVHGLVAKGGFCEDGYVYNTLVSVYARCGEFGCAMGMVERMGELDVIAWNAVLSAYMEMGLVEEGVGLFNEMPVRNLESWNFVVSGCGELGLVEVGRRVFDEMVERNVVSWNGMIKGYVKVGDYGEVLRLFGDMVREGDVVPDSCTLVNVLLACGGVGALRHGEWIRGYIDRKGVEVDGVLGSALVDMYCKCGCIEKAVDVFNSTSRKDVSTWNSMISGLGVHGYGKSALDTFSRMIADGCKPNDVTFVGILAACSREGLLEEGREVFSKMGKVYAVEPSVEHYGCMVDLLGKFGLLKEAEVLMEAIPVKECAGIWTSLLNACRNHGDLVLAERIAKKLHEVDPLEGAKSVQLSNANACTGKQ